MGSIFTFSGFFFSFMLFRLGPGDPVLVILGNKYDPSSQSAQNLREELGLDKPLMVQFANYSVNFFQGDFGESYRYRGQSVRKLISQRCGFLLNYLWLHW
ncbi:MAG: hypothetical protein CM1200mP7_0130 [Chloroflexota bacterium]|nr:MAG: hypothetical protein CM1200mP7_0130 [Chloroflexota bacterium]